MNRSSDDTWWTFPQWLKFGGGSSWSCHLTKYSPMNIVLFTKHFVSRSYKFSVRWWNVDFLLLDKNWAKSGLVVPFLQLAVNSWGRKTANIVSTKVTEKVMVRNHLWWKCWNKSLVFCSIFHTYNIKKLVGMIFLSKNFFCYKLYSFHILVMFCFL
jgi:hypothetical protein